MLDTTTLRALSSNLVSDPDDYMRSFRHNVSMYIEQKGITLQEVAEEADISLSTLKSFLYGDSKDCNLSTAVKLAKVFHVSMDELVGCGTISPQTCESLQLVRQLPESFTHFVRWAIHFHDDMLKSQKVSIRAIEIMNAEEGPEGNLKMNNNFDVMDISDISDDIRPKIFMGIKLPSNMYAPKYYQSDIILMANDRKPRQGEHIVVCISDNMWIVEYRERKDDAGILHEEFVSIRDGRVRAKDDEVQLIMGYIAKIGGRK